MLWHKILKINELNSVNHELSWISQSRVQKAKKTEWCLLRRFSLQWLRSQDNNDADNGEGADDDNQ